MAILITKEREEIPLHIDNLPVGERVVLTTSHNLSFAGILQGELNLYQLEGCYVMLDENTCFTIWCPLTEIQRLLVVPIKIEADADDTHAPERSEDPVVADHV